MSQSYARCKKSQKMQEVSMSRSSKILVATLMLAALFLSSAAQAMDINDYFNMADQD